MSIKTKPFYSEEIFQDIVSRRDKGESWYSIAYDYNISQSGMQARYYKMKSMYPHLTDTNNKTTPLTIDHYLEIDGYVKQGKGWTEIGNILGMDYNTVSSRYKKLSKQFASSIEFKETDESLMDIVNLCDEYGSYVKASQKYNINQVEVRRLYNKVCGRDILTSSMIERYKTITEMRSNGKSWGDLSKIFKKTRGAVAAQYKVLEKMTKEYNHLTKEDITLCENKFTEINNLINKGLSFKSISDSLNISELVVFSRYKKLNPIYGNTYA